MDSATQPKPRYSWRKTWDDKEDDFVCEVDGQKVARMYLHHTGVWTWFMNASWLPGINGASDAPRKAACEAEDAFDRAQAAEVLRRSSLGAR